MRKNILHLHLTRTGGKSICSAILRSKKYEYIQLSKFFSNQKFISSTNKEKMDQLLPFLKSHYSYEKPLFITGHIDFNPYFYSNNFKVFTLLRNPFQRLKSYFYYYFNDPTNPLYKKIKSKFNTFEEFASSPTNTIQKIKESNFSRNKEEEITLILRNGQSRQIANISYLEKISDDDLLNEALEIMSKIDFISTSENLKFSYPYLKKLMHLPPYYHLPVVNVSRKINLDNIEPNKECYELNKVDYFIWKIINLHEKMNYKNSKNNISFNFEECDRIIYGYAKRFKYKILNIFDKFRDNKLID